MQDVAESSEKTLSNADQEAMSFAEQGHVRSERKNGCLCANSFIERSIVCLKLDQLSRFATQVIELIYATIKIIQFGLSAHFRSCTLLQLQQPRSSYRTGLEHFKGMHAGSAQKY